MKSHTRHFRLSKPIKPGIALPVWEVQYSFRILQLREIKERLALDGRETAGESSQQFHEFLQRDVANGRMVVALAGIKAGN